MQIFNLVTRAIRRFTSNEQDKFQISSVPSGGADILTSRRTLLAGGVALAGVSTLASTDASAAITYVKLGAQNTTNTFTMISSTGRAGFIGVSRASTGMGVQGICNVSGGTGVLGIANSGGSAAGVSGTTDTGVGVKGTATGNGYGVRGTGGYNGVYGSGGSYGGIFYCNTSGGTGVYAAGATALYGSGSNYGLQAFGTTGVYGSGSTGVYGVGGPIGVRGYTGAGGDTAGVQGEAPYRGVKGYGGNAGVYGNSGYVGHWGEGGTYGFFGLATATSGQNYGVFGSTNSSAGFAGYFQGNVAVAGTLSKTAGSFKIDHPLDPERKWLQHSFIESPDMMNIYNGNVTTDGSGLAVVKLPAYFGALNRDFRYQLTVIGKMAQAVVDREISKNQFRIRTSEGHVKVSWQVTGIRQDAYAKANPIKVEVAKSRTERGTRAFVPEGSFGRRMELAPADNTVRAR